MIQKFIVTIDSDEKITSKEVAEALNMTSGVFSLGFNHDDIIVATARKYTKQQNRKR